MASGADLESDAEGLPTEPVVDAETSVDVSQAKSERDSTEDESVDPDCRCDEGELHRPLDTEQTEELSQRSGQVDDELHLSPSEQRIVQSNKDGSSDEPLREVTKDDSKAKSDDTAPTEQVDWPDRTLD